MTYRASWDALGFNAAGNALPPDVVPEYVYNDSRGNMYVGLLLQTPSFAEPPDCTTVTATVRARASGYAQSDAATRQLLVNRPPVWSSIPDQTVEVGGSFTLDLADYVTDRAGPLASYVAYTNDSEVTVTRTGSEVRVDGESDTGVTTVTVTVGATDTCGLQVLSSFEVAVTDAVVVGSFPTFTAASRFIDAGDTEAYDLRNYSADAETSDADLDFYGVSAFGQGVMATASLDSDGYTMRVTADSSLSDGDTFDVEWTIEDEDGNTTVASWDFTVGTAPLAPLRWSSEPESVTIEVGESYEWDMDDYVVNETGGSYTISFIGVNTSEITVTEQSGNVVRAVGVAEGVDDFTIRIRTANPSRSLTTSVRVTIEPGTPIDPCDGSEVTAPDPATVAAGSSGFDDASHSGFPSGSGSWDITEGPSWISVNSNGRVSWAPGSSVPGATYSYTVEYSRGNCTDEDSSSVTVTGAPTPCPTVSLSGGGTVLGGSTNLLTWTDNGSATVQTETWSASGGTVTPGEEGEADWEAPAQQATDRNYTATVRVQYTNGCDETDSVTFTVEGMGVDPCANASVSAPDITAMPGNSGNGQAGFSGFPSGIGSWTVTDQPSIGSVSVNTFGIVAWTVPSGSTPGSSTYEVRYSRGGCAEVASGTVTVEAPTPPTNNPPVIANIQSVFLTNVPHDGNWFVTISITDDNDARGDLEVSVSSSSGIGAQVSLSSDTVMQITTSGLIDVGDTFDVTITATDTEDATSVRTFTFTISD